MNCWQLRSSDGLMLAAAALACAGCSPGDGANVETLPWHNASHASVPRSTTSPGDSATTPTTRADAGELQFRDRIVQECLEDLRRIAAHQIVVEAVQEAATSNWQTQQQIEQTDLQWRQTQGVDDPLIQKYLKNPCADLLRKVQSANPAYLELFVMDNKGCIVAESVKTSDYWQGDEEKWTECFNNGSGRIFVGDVEYDQSTRSYVVQISLPVLSNQQTTIGAMTVSISSGTHESTAP